MFSGLPYPTRYSHTFGTRNGLTCRLEVGVVGYTGSPVAVRASSRRAGCVVSWGTGSGGDAASPLSPVAPSTCAVRLFTTPTDRREGTADLASLGALPTGRVRLRVLLDLTTPGEPSDLVWMGYNTQGAVSDTPGEALVPVDLTFRDGFGLLASRAATDPADPDHQTTTAALVDWLRGWLAPLAGNHADPGSAVAALSLVTRVDWRPYLPGATVDFTTDPLAAVHALAQAWADPPEGGSQAGVTSQMVAARQTAARFLGRLFFGRDGAGRVGWHLLQRSVMCREAARAPSAIQTLAIPAHVYPLSGGVGGEALAPVAVDTLGWGDADGGWLRYQTRARDGAVGQVESTYDFRPELETLTANGSFETPRATAGGVAATEAEAWETFGDDTPSNVPGASPTRMRRVALSSESPPVFEPVFGDTHALRFTDDRATPTQPTATQAAYVYVAPLGTATAFRLRARLHWFPEAGAAFDASKQAAPARLRVFTKLATGGEAALARATVAASADVLRGKGVRVPIGAALAAAAGAATGTTVVPAGATLRFGSAADAPALDLSRPVRVGDTEVEGDLDAGITSGATADVYYFTTDVGEGVGVRLLDLRPPGPAQATEIDLAVHTNLLAVDGSAVAGSLTTEFRGARIATASGTPVADASLGTEEWTADRVRAELVLFGGGRIGTSGARAALPAGVPSVYAASVPVADSGGHALGDGPLPDSATRLLATPDGGATLLPTQQGASTGWRAGTYFSTSTPSSRRTIDQLAAAESVAMLAGRATEGSGPEQWSGVLRLPTRAAFDPAAVHRLYVPCQLAEPAATGASSVVLTAPPKVGQKVVIGTGADAETRLVGSVSGAYACTLVTDTGQADPLDRSHARHTPCLYGMPAWWETAAWDLSEAEVALDARDLAWRDPGATSDTSTLIEELTLGA